MTTEHRNLLGMTRPELEDWFRELGEKPFHARQCMKWIYKHGVDDFAQMTDLSKSLRARLTELAEVRAPEVAAVHESEDGTVKWLLRMGAAQAVETVFIPEPDRGTLCISSQVGCALDCTFCATGAQGFNRNLSAAEIVGQVWLAARTLEEKQPGGRGITNVVFMGMGEPLANYRAVLPSLRVLLDDKAFELSRRRVTLSTSGLVPQLKRLGVECNVALAISLHAPNDELRDEIVPINRKHNIAELLHTAWEYADGHGGRHVTFEYVMLDGVNDTPAHARQLLALMKNRPAKVNLIPFNPFPGSDYRRSNREVIDRFQGILLRGGVRTTTRRTRGDDIDAACGQLAGRVFDRTTARLGTKPRRVSAAQ
ncbi:MAG: 23S rRNA (adenine(2503)-C(2))-methyltransferase RlmN [Pseudomonadota bacterium]